MKDLLINLDAYLIEKVLCHASNSLQANGKVGIQLKQIKMERLENDNNDSHVPTMECKKHGKTCHNFFIRLDLNPIFLTRSKNRLTRDSICVFYRSTQLDPNSNHFLKLFFSKKIKLRQYWFNCLL